MSPGLEDILRALGIRYPAKELDSGGVSSYCSLLTICKVRTGGKHLHLPSLWNRRQRLLHVQVLGVLVFPAFPAPH